MDRAAWKAVLLDWDVIGNIDNEETRITCLTMRQIAILSGLLEQASWRTRWQNLPSGENIVALCNDISQRLQGFCCEDLVACLIPEIERVVNTIVDSSTREIIDALMEQYDGTPQSIAPSIVYGDADDVYRDLAQCIALGLLVDALAEGELERRQRGLLTLDRASNIFQSAAILLLQIAAPYAWIAVTGTALVGVANDILNVWRAIEDVVLLDETARDEVVCCAYSNLSGALPTFGVFNDALVGCTFGVNGTIIANAIAPIFDDLEMYVTYLNFLENAFKLAKSGLLDGSCDCENWEVEFLGGNDNHEWFTILSGVSDGNAAAVYDAVNDQFVAQPRTATPNYHIGVVQLLDTEVWGLREIEAHIEIQASGPPRGQRIDAYIDTETYPGDHALLNQSLGSGTHVLSVTNQNLYVRGVSIRWSGGPDPDTAKLTYVRIRGFGNNPFV